MEHERVEELTQALAQPVRAELVQTRTVNNLTMRYLRGATAIREANRLFGWQNWQNSVLELKLVPLDKGGIVYCTQQVTAFGVTHCGVGCSPYHNTTPDALDTAIKGAATDALKRALINFGEALGLSLYDEEPASQPAPQPRKQAAPPPSDEVTCEWCGSPIEPYDKYTPQDLAAIRKRKYGAVLCAACVHDYKTRNA